MMQLCLNEPGPANCFTEADVRERVAEGEITWEEGLDEVADVSKESLKGIGEFIAGTIATEYTAFRFYNAYKAYRAAKVAKARESVLQELGTVSGSTRATVAKVRGPIFENLKDHAARHSSLNPNAYYNAAVKHLTTGTKFTFRHDGQFKNAFITRTGPDGFTFTSASTSGKRIFTHMEVDTQYLRNIGITLPVGF